MVGWCRNQSVALHWILSLGGVVFCIHYFEHFYECPWVGYTWNLFVRSLRCFLLFINHWCSLTNLSLYRDLFKYENLTICLDISFPTSFLFFHFTAHLFFLFPFFPLGMVVENFQFHRQMSYLQMWEYDTVLFSLGLILFLWLVCWEAWTRTRDMTIS